jgi:hypothetical protein
MEDNEAGVRERRADSKRSIAEEIKLLSSQDRYQHTVRTITFLNDCFLPSVRQKYIRKLTHQVLRIERDFSILALKSVPPSEIEAFEASPGMNGGPCDIDMRPDFATMQLKSLWNQKWTELMTRRVASHFNETGAKAADCRSDEYWKKAVWAQLGTMNRIWRKQTPRIDPNTGEEETAEAVAGRIMDNEDERLRRGRHTTARCSVCFFIFQRLSDSPTYLGMDRNLTKGSETSTALS